MADRGDVLRLKRRLGFSARGEAESVIVVQATPLNAALPTLLVVPLGPAVGAYAGSPAVLRVTREEVGSTVDHVAVPWNMRAVNAAAFARGPRGRLKPATVAALDEHLLLVLGLD
jgi:mRNA-degrading endonuclease toxin of MazEF toxin-antitoxin module